MDYDNFKKLLQIKVQQRSVDDINALIKFSYVNIINKHFTRISNFQNAAIIPKYFMKCVEMQT